jgi:hypothetical protein
MKGWSGFIFTLGLVIMLAAVLAGLPALWGFLVGMVGGSLMVTAFQV